MSFPRYPAYKDSGVEWLGQVPAHWTLPPLSNRYETDLGKMLDEKRITGSHLVPYLRNVDVQWDRINVDDLPQMDFAPHEHGRFLLRTGDLLVCEGGEVGRAAIWTGGIAECAFQKALHRVRPRDSAQDPRYLFYTFRFAADRGVFEANGNPNTILHLTGQQLRAYRFPNPPLAEQRQISAFLDRETAKIDALVAEQERLIALLKEKRQAVISHAVTKGLNPDAPMKDSGVAWIGQVPNEWVVVPLRSVARLESGHTPSRQRPDWWVDCTIPWFSLSDVWQIREGKADVVFETSEKVSELGLANSSARLLPAGTVMLSRTASVGFSAIMGVPMATTQDFANWICGPRLLPHYLLHVFRAMVPEFGRLKMGSTHNTIYMPDIAAFRCPLPSIDEQYEIVAALKRWTEELDRLLIETEQALQLLAERRSSLITAAVTGQIDVRSLASAEAA